MNTVTSETKPWIDMVKQYIDLFGDPFAPRQGMTDERSQTGEVRCYGCDAVGTTKWPEWHEEIEHQPECGWIAWQEMLKNV